MRIDRHLLGWVIVIDVVYLISFFLPVYRFGDTQHPGWEVFVDYVRDFVEPNDAESFWNKMVIWAPNPLLWVGVVCLWARRPHLALAAGGLAALVAGHTLYGVEYFSFTHVAAGDEIQALWDRSGAYAWFASMVLLLMAATFFTIKQWRETRRLPMMGER